MRELEERSDQMDHTREAASRRRDQTLERLIGEPDVRAALSSLGIFARSYSTDEGFGNYLWHSWGYTDEQVSEAFWRSVIHPDDLEATDALYERVLAGEAPTFRMTYRIRTASGEWRWVATSGAVVTRDSTGRAVLYVGADLDVTERMLTDEALALAKQEAEERAQEAEALRSAGGIVVSTLDIDRTVQLVLEQALAVVPYDTATVQLLREGELEVVGGNGWPDLDAVRGLRIPCPGENPHSRAIEQGKPLSLPDLQRAFPRFSNISGQEIRSWLGVPLVVHGRTIGLLALDSATPDFFTPKHVRMAAAFGDHVAVALHNAHLYEQAREMAMTDSLTGTATRRSFFADAERLLDRARRSGAPVSVLMADLDHFKEINDLYGHAKGDEAIRRAAATARDVLRRSDIIGRYGGEEFAIILPDTSAEAALVIAERLRSRVETTDVPGTSRTLSVSIGVTTVEGAQGESVDEVLECADQALLEAKRTGRNRVVVYRAPDVRQQIAEQP